MLILSNFACIYPQMNKFNRILNLVFMVLASVSVSASIGGSGTVDDPFTINSADDLKQLSDNVKGGDTYDGKYLKLTSDIDLYAYSTDGWQPIGWGVNAMKRVPFCGNFDGDGHSISGMYFDKRKQNFVGLFGYVRFGVISNLTVKNFSLNGNETVGVVVGGMSDGAVLKNVRVENGQVSGSRFVGGLVGQMSKSCVVEGCENFATVSSNKTCGGIVGLVDGESAVRNCVNAGQVSGSVHNVGGVAGMVTKNSRIEQSANRGEVRSKGMRTGGIVGYIASSTIYMCSNTGKIQMNDDYAGGISGYASHTKISSSVNAAVVENTDLDGKPRCIGGISGYAAGRSVIDHSLNCGDVIAGEESGAIVGYRKGVKLQNTYYDGQMCVSRRPFGNKKHDDADSTRLFTFQMMGDSLKDKLNGEWEYQEGFYPRLKGTLTSDITYAASAPLIFRDTTENVYSISDSFDLALLDSTQWRSRRNAVFIRKEEVEGRILEVGMDTLVLEKNGAELRSIPIKTTHRIPYTEIIVEKGFSMDAKADTTLHMVEGLPAGVWSSDNEKVLSVNAKTGKLTALKKGSAKITCTLSNGDKQSITVSVTDEMGDKAKAEQLAERISVHFDFNNAWDGKMDADEQAAYDELVELMKEYDDIKVVLTGNTCNIGSYKVNVRMGMLRATTIKKWMVRRGVKEENIEVRSMAYTKPVKAHATEEHRRQNRRVDVVIVRE